MLEMVREGTTRGALPNSSDFIAEFEVSRRTVARDLDFLRDEERAPDPMPPAGLQDRVDHRAAFPCIRRSEEQVVLFSQCRRPDRVLNKIVVDLKPPVFHVTQQLRPQ